VGVVARSSFLASDNHNYLIAGNLCNAFVLGQVGSPDDFFLLGADPGPDETSYPLLSGTILDSDGEVLFRLVKNELTVNPGRCSKFAANRLSYEIHDSGGVAIIKVETRYIPLGGNPEPTLTTTLAASFYNKKKELVFSANSGDEDERIDTRCNCAFGYQPGCSPSDFVFNIGLTPDDCREARAAMKARGGTP